MALGTISTTIETSGGATGANAQAASRQVIILGMSPLATPNTLLRPQSVAALRSGCDIGQLVDAAAAMFAAPGAPPPMVMALAPTTGGALSAAVTHVGTGTGTITPSLAPHKAIKVVIATAGGLGTMAAKFSLDGGVSFGPTVTSVAGATWAYRVPGTYTTVTFQDNGPYVQNSSLVVGADGSVSAWSGGGAGTVTHVSSPIDSYTVVCTPVAGGALGTATLSISLDGGITTMPTVMVPASGVVVIAGTGLVLTCANAFVAGDSYSFLAAGPSCSTSDVTAALAAMLASSPPPPTAATIHVCAMPGSAAGAMSLAAAVEAQLEAAFVAGFNYNALVDCPSASGGYSIGGNIAGVGPGDIIASAGAAVHDTADSDATVRAARVGHTYNRVAVCVGTNATVSAVTGQALARGTSFVLAALVASTDPGDGVAQRSLGPVGVYAIGRDERLAPTSLHDAQYNVLQSLQSGDPVLAIEAGGVGYRHMTTDPMYQDADALRALNTMLAAVAPVGNSLIGQRPAAKADGTIEEKTRLRYSAKLDGAAKRSMGMIPGGAFVLPQASMVSAVVLPTSQVGLAPHQLDVEYVFQPKGFVSQIKQVVHYSGATV
jgi:hypothetical protein